MMPVANIQLQLIDTPPLARDYVDPELVDLIRRADLVLLVVDVNTDPMRDLGDTVSLLAEHRIAPRPSRDKEAGPRGWTFLPFLVLANKCDNAEIEEHFEIFRELTGGDLPLLPVSAATGRNLEMLKTILMERLEIIRIYSRTPGREPDFTAPFILKKGSTVADFAGKVHKDFVKQLKWARIWGTTVYDGQKVHRDHLLQDGDVVELHI